MRLKLLTLNSTQVRGTLLVLSFALLVLSLSISFSNKSQTAYALHSCIEGAEVAFHTNASSVCLNPFELKSACSPPGGSLAGNPVCSAVSSSGAIKENFPTVQNYVNSGQGIPGGEQEIIEEGQGIPGGEQEIIEEGQGIPGGEQEIIEEGQ
jgi:hypothetical protein